MHLTLTPERLRIGALAGIVGAAAFAVWMKLDMRVTGERVDDFRLLGRFGPLAQHWQAKGATIHIVNGALLGAAYSTVEPRLPGPGWLRGVTFALVENTLLWPLVVLTDRFHPDVRSGDMPSFNRFGPFVLETLRHVIYGATVGYVFERMNRRDH